MDDGADKNRVAELERELREAQAQNQQLMAQQGGGKPAAGKWRFWLQGFLLVLGLLVVIPASMLLWLGRTVTTTDGYLKAVGPAIHEPAVQKAVQKASTDAILSRVDVSQVVAQALPDNAQFLAAPIAVQVKNYTSTVIGNIVASPKFADLWVNVNRRAQQRFMDIARNSSGNPVVNVNDLYSYVSAQLADTRLSVLANRSLPPQVGDIQVANVPALQKIPHFVATLTTWRWVLLGLAVVLLAASVWAAPHRRRAIIWIGLGWIVTTIVSLALVRIARSMSVDQISDSTYRAGAVALWQTVLNPFFVEVLVLTVVGLATILVGWLLGPGRVASGMRSGTERSLAGLRVRMMPRASDSAFLRFMRQYRVGFRWALLVLTVLAMISFTPLTVGSVSVILLVALILLVILEFLAAPDAVDAKT